MTYAVGHTSVEQSELPNHMGQRQKSCSRSGQPPSEEHLGFEGAVHSPTAQRGPHSLDASWRKRVGRAELVNIENK